MVYGVLVGFSVIKESFRRLGVLYGVKMVSWQVLVVCDGKTVFDRMVHDGVLYGVPVILEGVLGVLLGKIIVSFPDKFLVEFGRIRNSLV